MESARKVVVVVVGVVAEGIYRVAHTPAARDSLNLVVIIIRTRDKTARACV